MKIADIKLENGLAKHAQGRTVASVTGLDPKTEIEYVESRTRMVGTGYSNDYYRIKGTSDALEVCFNDGPIDNVTWTSVRVIEGYFDSKTAYAKEVGRLTNKYNLPFEIGLALGTEELNYDIIKKYTDVQIDTETIADLCAGIDRRKNALRKILTEEDFVLLKICNMGQVNSKRIAYYISEHCVSYNSSDAKVSKEGLESSSVKKLDTF